jgi:FkbM family methyltransferase
MSKLNTPKELLKKTRDRFLSEVIESIAILRTRLEVIYQEQSAFNSRQLELYKHLSQQNKHLSQQITNSGIVQISEHEVIAKLFNGLKIYLDTRDISVAPHLALDGIWEPQITQAWLSVIKAEDTVFDIGANFGYFGLVAAHKTNKKKSKIVFFEANPDLIPYINKTLSTNFYVEQSKVENLAIAEREGTVTLNILKDYIGSSTLHPLKHLDKYMHDKMLLKVNKSIKVNSTSIDSYCMKNQILKIDLIKMDIEGYEDEAYQGMRKIVRKSPDLTLFVEFTKDSYKNPKDFYERMLEDFGNIYLVNERGSLYTPEHKDYHSILGKADDWVMLVFSKNKNLAKK